MFQVLLSQLKRLTKEGSTWLGLAMLVEAGRKFYMEGNTQEGIDALVLGIVFIVMRGRDVRGLLDQLKGNKQ